MNRVYNVTIDNLTENDMCEIFCQAINQLGILPGHSIPSDMVNLREMVIRIMFKEFEVG